jgi:hypothetical protein
MTRIEALTFELRSQVRDAEAKYRKSRSDVAKTEFLRALAKFTDLVVRGQVPAELRLCGLPLYKVRSTKRY